MARFLPFVPMLGATTGMGTYLIDAFDDALVAAIMTLIALISFAPFLAHQPGNRPAH